jgi:chromosome partitioning protein
MIIVVANQKGGVGKTTTAINLAAACAAKGKRTLLIDLDPQSNSTLSFLEPDRVGAGSYELFTEPDRDLNDLVYETNVQNLKLVPARISLAKLEAKLIGDFDAAYRLRDRLQKASNDFDLIFIDTPPTLGLITVNALVAAQHVMIPIQSSYFALEGTDDLLETIEKVRSRPNPELELLGVLVTLFDRRTALSRDVDAHIRQVFGDKAFKTVITRSVRLEEAPAHRKPIFDYAPRSSGSAEYQELAKEVLKRVKKRAANGRANAA